MRIFKVVLFVFASSSVVGLFFDDWESVGGFIVSSNLLLHLAGCVVLYAIIAVRLLMHERKMSWRQWVSTLKCTHVQIWLHICVLLHSS